MVSYKYFVLISSVFCSFLSSPLFYFLCQDSVEDCLVWWVAQPVSVSFIFLWLFRDFWCACNIIFLLYLHGVWMLLWEMRSLILLRWFLSLNIKSWAAIRTATLLEHFILTFHSWLRVESGLQPVSTYHPYVPASVALYHIWINTYMYIAVAFQVLEDVPPVQLCLGNFFWIVL